MADRGIPVRRHQTITACDHGRHQAFGIADGVVAETPSIAHPSIVDLVIAAWDQPPDAIFVGRGHDIAAIRASGANRPDIFKEPYADLVMKILGLKCSDRADISGAHRIIVIEAAVVNVEQRMVAVIKDGQFAGLTDFTAETDAAPAENATFLIEKHVLADIQPLAMFAAWLQRTRKAAAKAHRIILQPTFAGLVANRTIQWMVQQEHLKHAASIELDFRLVGVHHHTVADFGVAGDLKLGHAFDAYLAQPATAVDAELWMVAVMRNIEASVEHHL